MNKIPLVTICIPTYNVESTLGSTIESIINQSYKNIIIKIVDNCSSDKTLKIAASFKDKRIKIFLDEYSDKELHRQISEVKLDLKVWFAAKHISKDQSFTKNEQTIFENMFGTEMLDKLKNFFSTIQMSELSAEIEKKISEGRKKLSSLTPSEARNIEVELAGAVAAKFVET